MNIERFDIEQNGAFIVRFKMALDKRLEVRIFPLQGIYGKAEISISTATLDAEDSPVYMAMLAMAQAEAVRLNALYEGKATVTV